jgi:hypothetical protein
VCSFNHMMSAVFPYPLVEILQRFAGAASDLTAAVLQCCVLFALVLCMLTGPELA